MKRFNYRGYKVTLSWHYFPQEYAALGSKYADAYRVYLFGGGYQFGFLLDRRNFKTVALFHHLRRGLRELDKAILDKEKSH